MGNIDDYWALDRASEEFGVSKNTLTKWRLDAIDNGHSELAEADAKFGVVSLYRKDKWLKLLEIHYVNDILHLRKLGLIFDQEQMQSGLSKAYEEGFAEGKKSVVKEILTQETLTASSPRIPLDVVAEPETNEPLVDYATTKGPDFTKLTDGNGFQSIV